jgi:NADH dehydrogenase [ubiquinone] 1 alpha subcomplex assembly factor 6
VTEAGSPNYCAESVRANDPDRYKMAMLTPSTLRQACLTLYAFNLEIARTRELISEPPLGEIRLQWWRDEIGNLYTGAGFRHAVGEALMEVITEFGLPQALFDRLIDARGADLDDGPPETVDTLLRYAEETTAPLLVLSLEVLGDRSVEALRVARHIGIAWSLIGLVRALPFHLRARRQYFPSELLDRHEVVRRDLLEIKPSQNLNNAVAEISGLAGTHLQAAASLGQEMGRRATPILLQGSLTEIYRRRLSRFDFNPFDPRLAEAPPMITWRLMFRKIARRY